MNINFETYITRSIDLMDLQGFLSEKFDDDLKAGDLVTIKQNVNPLFWGNTAEAVTARQPGLKAWDLWIPRSSIMTIIKITTPSVNGLQTIATVFHDGQILEVFLSDIERMDSVTQ